MMITLPYPPTMNHYWLQRKGHGRYISAKGKSFTTLTRAAVITQGVKSFGDARLSMQIILYPPDHRRRDLDNVLKPTLDALQKAGVYDDDCQIDHLHITRGPKFKGGKMEIFIVAIPADEERAAA